MAIGETTIYLIELLGIPVFYDVLSEWIKPSTRPLTEEEISLSQI